MPRYFVTTFDRTTARDDEGVELSDLGALAVLLRQTLTGIVEDEAAMWDHVAVRGEARDERGEVVMSASVRLTVETARTGRR